MSEETTKPAKKAASKPEAKEPKKVNSVIVKRTSQRSERDAVRYVDSMVADSLTKEDAKKWQEIRTALIEKRKGLKMLGRG